MRSREQASRWYSPAFNTKSLQKGFRDADSSPSHPNTKRPRQSYPTALSPPWLSIFWAILLIVGELEKRKSQSSAMSPARPDPEDQGYFQVQPWCCKLSLTKYITLPLPCHAKRFCCRGNQLRFRDGFGVALLTQPHQVLWMVPACLGCALVSAQTLPC